MLYIPIQVVTEHDELSNLGRGLVTIFLINRAFRRSFEVVPDVLGNFSATSWYFRRISTTRSIFSDLPCARTPTGGGLYYLHDIFRGVFFFF